MNNTVKALTKGMRGSHFLSIITTGCVTSLLTLEVAIAPCEAATFTGDVMGTSSTLPNYDGYDGNWTFDVEVVPEPKPGTVNFKVQFGGKLRTYKIPIIEPVTDGIYQFEGGSNALKLKGSYDPNNEKLDFKSVTSKSKINKQDYEYTVKNLKLVPDKPSNPTPDSDPAGTKIPESSSPITLLAFGILGTGAIVKRHLKSAKTSQKQSDHNSTDYPQKEVSKVS